MVVAVKEQYDNDDGCEGDKHDDVDADYSVGIQQMCRQQLRWNRGKVSCA